MTAARNFDGRNRRDDVKMSNAEIEGARFHGPHCMALATLKADNSIHLVTVGYAYIDGVIWTKSQSRAQKVVNLLRHPYASCTMSAGDGEYHTVHGPYARGHASIVDASEAVLLVTRRITSRFRERVPGTDSDDESIQRLTEGYVAIRYDNPKLVTWDHRKLESKEPS